MSPDFYYGPVEKVIPAKELVSEVVSSLVIPAKLVLDLIGEQGSSALKLARFPFSRE